MEYDIYIHDMTVLGNFAYCYTLIVYRLSDFMGQLVQIFQSLTSLKRITQYAITDEQTHLRNGAIWRILTTGY